MLVCYFYLSERGGLHRVFLFVVVVVGGGCGPPTVPCGILAERLPFPASLISYTIPWQVPGGTMASEKRQPLPLLLTDHCSKGYRVQTYLIVIVIIVLV